jgi:hypothetical protein
MANPNRTEDVVKPATETANKIETAVRTNDKAGYDNAMTEVNKFRENHSPVEMKAYTTAITQKLEADKVLPTVSLFEAQNSFDKIALGGNRLERGKLDLYKHRDDVNDVQKALITNIEDRYDNIKMVSTWGENFYGGNADDIHRQDINDGVKEQQAQMNIYAPDQAGKTLVEKLRDKDGNIPHSSIANLEQLEKQHPGQYLTPEDKKSLEDISSKRSWYSYLPFTDDVSKDRLTKMATDSGVKQEDLEAQKRGAKISTPTTPDNLSPRELQLKEDAAREDQRAQDALKREDARTGRIPYPTGYTRPETHPSNQSRDYDRYGRNERNDRDSYYRNDYRNDYRSSDRDGSRDGYRSADRDRHEHDRANDEKIAAALKVRSGESYAHSAERLLALAGNSDPSSKELKEVSHQLWVADHQRKKNELKSGQKLNIDSTLRSNPALARLFDGSEL